MGILTWFAETLRQYPEIAIFLTLAIGYYFGKFTFRGIGLGAVTATLMAGVLIGQLGIKISQPLKATVFLMFLFAVGYAVGPQFVRGVAKDGVPQAIFSAVQCVFCLFVPFGSLKLPAIISAMRRDFTRGRKPFPPPWAFQQMPSTGWDCQPTRPRTCLTGCRSPTP